MLVVDDGSSDDTAEQARTAGATVLRLPFNLGIGGAMQSGYIYALEHGYDVAVQVDGDGQHDPRHIRDLLDRLQRRPRAEHGHRIALPRPEGDGYRSSAARRVGHPPLRAGGVR